MASEQAQAIEKASAENEANARMQEIEAQIQIEAPKIQVQREGHQKDIILKQMDIAANTGSDEEKTKLKVEMDKLKSEIRQADKSLSLQAQKQKDDKDLGYAKLAVDKIKAKSTPKVTAKPKQKKK